MYCVEVAMENALAYIGCMEGQFKKKDGITMVPLSEYQNVSFLHVWLSIIWVLDRFIVGVLRLNGVSREK